MHVRRAVLRDRTPTSSRRSTAWCALALLGSAVGLAAAACGGAAPGPVAESVHGTEGRTRWVVRFSDAGPDVTAYRTLLQKDPAGARELLARKRVEMRAARSDFVAGVESVGGRVVELWWMSNAATIEVAAAGLPTIRQQAGVASVDPDGELH